MRLVPVVRLALAASIAFAAHAAPPSAGVADRRVFLRAVEAFDPVSERPDFRESLPPAPEEQPVVPDARRYFLVQLEGPVRGQTRAALTRLDAKIVGYVPNHALVVGVGSSVRLADLVAAPAVRFAGRFLAAYRLDPGLARALGEPVREGDRLSIDVELFPGERTEPLLAAVEERFDESAVRAVFVRRGEPARPSRLTFEVDGRLLRRAAGLFVYFPTVAYVRRLSPLELHNDNSVWIGQSYDRLNGPVEASAADPKPYPLSATVWNRGLTGAGQVVAVADTGLEHETCFWQDPGRPVVPQQVTPPGSLVTDPSHRKVLALNGVNAFTLLDDGTFRHGTHVATTVAGDDLAHLATGSSAGHDRGDGMAPAARIVFEDIGGPDNPSCTSTLWVASVLDLLAQEHAAGASISTNSWGTGDDRPDEVDSFVWDHEDFLVVFSAGNDGAAAINEIATNKNAVAVGATETYDAGFQDAFGILDPENVAAFSSLGPAADGRIKPDLMAPGFRIRSNNFPTQYVGSASDPQCTPGDPAIDVCLPGFGGCYLTFTDQTCETNLLSGTSMAAPAVAGLAALARQYLVDGFHPSGRAEPADTRVPSAALLKALLLNGARNMTGHRYERRGTPQDFGPLADAPSMTQGWGRAMLDDALFFAGDRRRTTLLDVANASGLSTGQTANLAFDVTDAAEPLELTLTWTDPPAASYAGVALINDLDLELRAPDGTLYRGNQWTPDDPAVPGDKISAANPPGRDSLNNVEGVRIPSPQAGRWTATVRAVDVPGFSGVLTQGYALVATGAVGQAAGSVGGLTVGKAAAGDVTLSWDASCRTSDVDYAVYEGTIGDFGDPLPRRCSTAGATSATLTPAGEATYYLVAPLSSDSEGSLGIDGAGVERPPSSSPCLARSIGVCD